MKGASITDDHVEALGPVFLYWIARLHHALSFLAATRNRKALFCTRAGKRMLDLLHAYAGTDLPYETELLGISRIAACKVAACGDGSFQDAWDVTAESLSGATLAELCRVYLQHGWDDRHPHMARLDRMSQPLTRDLFRALIAANDPTSSWFRAQLSDTRDGFGNYLRERQAGFSGFVLVDTGWKASIQRLLRATWPEMGFEGLYFGVMDTRPMADRWGLVFDAERYDPARPETVFALHRHLVEAVLEPEAPSVEELAGGPQDRLARAQLEAVETELPDPVVDALFLRLRDYLGDHAGQPPDRLVLGFRAALPRVVELLVHPSRDDALALAGRDRTIDFGRRGHRPVLVTEDWIAPSDRLKEALWPQGQLALEHDPATARQLQAATVPGRDYFAGHEAGAAAGDASVAVITRTKDRPLLLRRAAASVAAQTHADLHWVVVNDGGDPAPVRDVVLRSGVDPRRITLINNAESVGMEAASNMGVRAVDTAFVTIHDDDDSWEPEFLTTCVWFLQGARARAAGFEGVITRAMRVSEEIAGDRVIEHARVPYMPWVSEVSLTQMAVGNFFAPISFVFRRHMFDAIGGYDEGLPVLGDWRFNLDFLARANIGLIDATLSHYHHRDRGLSGHYANSVIGGQSLHAQYVSVVTNAILRGPDVPAGLVAAIGNAHQQRVMEQRLNRIDAELKELSVLKMPVDRALSEADRRYIAARLRAARPWIRQNLRELLAGPPEAWTDLVSRNFHRIPSPPDFDNITYLKDHPEIWATHYNGSGVEQPWHHYLVEGVAKGWPRPTLSK